MWSATNVFIDRDFAIKIMLPQIASTAEAAQRFLLEAKVSARINHPNIIEVIDVGQAEDGSLFLVMELLTGMSLEVAVRRQSPPMPVAEFLKIMRDVGRALAAAHRSGVIHRDLKPSNVFLHQDRDGTTRTKVLDFGVSKILEDGNNMSLTVVGTILGSPLYMSPEQAMGSAGIDGRTDVFAYGGILFEALTGQRAYEAPNFNALIVTIATKQPKPIDDIAPNLPGPVRALVRNCLVTKKDDRLASFEHIVERLTMMMPEVERTGLCLPPSSVPSLSPPPAVSVSRQTPAAALPPTGFLSTKPPDATLQGLQGDGHFVGLPLRPLALGSAVVALIVILGLAALRTDHKREWQPSFQGSRAAAAGSVAEPGTSSTAPTATGSNAVPLMSVDSLPLAASRPRKGNGKLAITANPGWCSVTIDGVARGVTPVGFVELSAGPHHVDCVPPSGKPRTATLVVSEGSAARFAFALEE